MTNIRFDTIAVLFGKLPCAYTQSQSLFTYGYSIFNIWYRKSSRDIKVVFKNVFTWSISW